MWYSGGMRRRDANGNWFPLSKPAGGSGREPTGEAFQTKWIDFDRGIRVGNIEPYERITQILKYHLEKRHATPFITDRWGRGVYWQWICWLPKANRQAKPLSHSYNFGCAKFFISVDKDTRVFQSGLQIERGYVAKPASRSGDLPIVLQDDWDWHRLVKQCWSGTALDRELQRLIKREGFVVEVGDWTTKARFDASNFRSGRQVRGALKRRSQREWIAFQLFYPMPAQEVQACTGFELVKAVSAVFDEVMPAMNTCMQVELAAGAK